jgi:hypothetical protein
MKTHMKKVMIAAAIVLGSLSPALASSHSEFTWHDNIRPHGHPRSQSIADAAVNYCYAQTGLSREDDITQAFKDCMATRSYTWVSTRLVQNLATKNPASQLAKGEFIDPDTGLVCHNTGFASLCESPPADMTIHYTNKYGLNCTRTGAMSICSNL